jgi:hypothetical protein
MKFDTPVIALILGVIGFYVKLLTAHRRKVREWEEEQVESSKSKKKKAQYKKKKPTFGDFSNNKVDWAVGAIGFLLAFAGAALQQGWFGTAQMQSVWWFPMTVGMVMFAWFFN